MSLQPPASAKCSGYGVYADFWAARAEPVAPRSEHPGIAPLVAEAALLLVRAEHDARRTAVTATKKQARQDTRDRRRQQTHAARKLARQSNLSRGKITRRRVIAAARWLREICPRITRDACAEEIAKTSDVSFPHIVQILSKSLLFKRISVRVVSVQKRDSHVARVSIPCTELQMDGDSCEQERLYASGGARAADEFDGQRDL